MNFIGIDIGSTAAKVSIFEDETLMENFVMATGWSSLETSNNIKNMLVEKNINIEESKIVATGYGRISVPYANKTLTEITCHGKGAYYLFGRDCTVIDIGGQDTKVISLNKGKVTNFIMNDKCAAGTGRFLELMSNTLAVSIEDLCNMAEFGDNINISSMCTVFAESEVISLIGAGEKKENIARGIINSIINRVYSLVYKHGVSHEVFLSGGLCGIESFVRLLSSKLNREVNTDINGKYAGSIGAALLAKELK